MKFSVKSFPFLELFFSLICVLSLRCCDGVPLESSECSTVWACKSAHSWNSHNYFDFYTIAEMNGDEKKRTVISQTLKLVPASHHLYPNTKGLKCFSLLFSYSWYVWKRKQKNVGHISYRDHQEWKILTCFSFWDGKPFFLPEIKLSKIRQQLSASGTASFGSAKWSL